MDISHFFLLFSSLFFFFIQPSLTRELSGLYRGITYDSVSDKNRSGFCHSIISSEQGDKCGYVSLSYIPLWPLYASFHLCYACLFLSFSSCSCSPPPLSVSPFLFFLSTEQRHVDMRPVCTATRERVSGAFDQLQDQTCPRLPCVHSSD